MLSGLFALLTIGCGGERASPPATDVREVKDCDGIVVRLPAVIRRVVTTAPGLTATVVEMGMGSTLVAVSDQDVQEGALAALPRIPVYPTIPAEAVAVASPDVLLVDRVLSGKNVDALRRRFPMTFATDTSSTLDRLRESFLRIAEALGVPLRGKKLADALDRARAKAKVDGRPKVLVLGQVDPPPPYAIGPQGLLGDMVASVGAENVAWDLPTPSGPVVSEMVVVRAPDWILHTGGRFPDALRAAWSSVPAVRSSRIRDIGNDDFQQGGPRTAVALEWLAKILSERGGAERRDDK